MDISFRSGDAFPADSVLAQWIVLLGAARNDLTYAFNRVLSLNEAGFSDALVSERIYLSRLVFSHYREAIKALWKADKIQEINEFIQSLSTPAQEGYEEIRVQFGKLPDTFVGKHVKPVRDSTFHYPEIPAEELAEALDGVADEKVGIYRDAETGTYGFQFADNAILKNIKGETSDEQLAAIFDELLNQVEKFIKFSTGAVISYLQTLPEGIVDWGDSENRD